MLIYELTLADNFWLGLIISSLPFLSIIYNVIKNYLKLANFKLYKIKEGFKIKKGLITEDEVELRFSNVK